MPWIKHKLRDADVWARVDDAGALVTDEEGRVDVVYKAQAGAKVYRARGGNLVATPGAPVEIDVGDRALPKAGSGDVKGSAAEPAAAAAPPASTSRAASRGATGGSLPAGAVAVWTDGACSGNPGPAGLGVVVVIGTAWIELSEYLGDGTNNIAELMAILRGLELVTEPARPVYVHTDSAYSIGVVSKNWKAKANTELILKIRKECQRFADLHFVKVAGHAGIALNEHVDELARVAVSSRRTTGPTFSTRPAR